MVIIEFPDGSDWYRANWIFRRFAADVIASAPEDAELRHAFEKGRAIGLLSMDRMEPDLLARAVLAMKEVAEQVAIEAVAWREKRPDDEALEQYISSIAELLENLRLSVRDFWGEW